MARSKHAALLSAAVLSVIAGSAFGQAGLPTHVSGLLHVPLGDATFDPASGRRLPVRNLGSSGQDGVAIVHQTGAGGLSCTVDMEEVMATPGARVLSTFVDASGAGEARMIFTSGGGGGGGGAGGLLGDFSTLGAQQVRCVLRDRFGNTLHDSVIDGPALHMSVQEDACIGFVSQESPEWEISGKATPFLMDTNGNWIKQRSLHRALTVQIDGLPPVSGVHEIAMFPIICITSPCPGGWGGMSSMRITGDHIPSGSLMVSDASLLRTVVPVNNPPTVERTLHVHGSSNVAFEDFCDLPPPMACAPEYTSLVVSNLGGPDDDCDVTLEFHRAESLHADGIIHRDLAARSARVRVTDINPTGAPGSPPVLSVSGNGHVKTGHITLLKFEVFPGPSAGTFDHVFDPSARGTTSSTIHLMNGAGEVLHTEIVSSSDPVSVSGCGAPTMQADGEFRADGSLLLRCCPPQWDTGGGSTVTLSSGVSIGGVDTMLVIPYSPTRPPAPISEADVKARSVSGMRLHGMETSSFEHAGGMAIGPIGPVTLTPEVGSDGRRRLTACCLGSSGEDGVEVQLSSALGGGATIDLSPLLEAGSAGTSGEIKIKIRGWDGVIYGNHRLSSAPGGGILEEMDFSGMGVVALRWRCLDADGNVLGEGEIDGDHAQWTVVPSDPTSTTLNKAYRVAPPANPGSSAARDARQGFFDIAVNVFGFAPTAIPAAAAIEITPILPDGTSPPELNTMAAMLITGAGFDTLHVSGFGSAIETPAPAGVPTLPVMVSGTGGGAVELHGAEAGRQTASVRNLGSSGQDGIEIVPISAASGGFGVQFNPVGGCGQYVVEHRCCRGHVIIMKIDGEDDESANARTMRPDGSGVGSSLVEVRCLAADGSLLHTEVMSPADSLTHPARCDGGASTYIGESDGTVSIRLCEPSSVSFSSGLGLGGVSRISLAPVAPTVAAGPADRCIVRGTNLERLDVDAVFGNGQCSPQFESQPQGATVCVGGTATLSVSVPANSVYWQVEAPGTPDGWTTLHDGPGDLDGDGAPDVVIAGAATTQMTVGPFLRTPASPPVFRAVAVTTCGSSASDSATVSYCPADFDCSESLDDLDIIGFFTAFENGDPSGDVNGDEGIDDLDIVRFFEIFEQGC